MSFLVQILPLDIRIVEPSLGVSELTPFDFVVTTDRWAECKYSFLDRAYEDIAATFDTGDHLSHSKTDFISTGTIYVKCKDEYDKIDSRSFVLAVDPSPPQITYKYADPVTEAPISTTLVVRTNEDTVCRYYLDDSQIDYANMNPFPNYNEDNENSYDTEHQQDLGASDLVDQTIWYGICRYKCRYKFYSIYNCS